MRLLWRHLAVPSRRAWPQIRGYSDTIDTVYTEALQWHKHLPDNVQKRGLSILKTPITPFGLFICGVNPGRNADVVREPQKKPPIENELMKCDSAYAKTLRKWFGEPHEETLRNANITNTFLLGIGALEGISEQRVLGFSNGCPRRREDILLQKSGLAWTLSFDVFLWGFWVKGQSWYNIFLRVGLFKLVHFTLRRANQCLVYLWFPEIWLGALCVRNFMDNYKVGEMVIAVRPAAILLCGLDNANLWQKHIMDDWVADSEEKRVFSERLGPSQRLGGANFGSFASQRSLGAHSRWERHSC